MSARVVYHCATNDAATPWAVAEQLNAAPITQHETRELAVTAARSQVADQGGGLVLVHAEDGTVLEQLQVADPALEQAGEHIERMDDTLDKSTSFGIPIVGLVFGPAAANALIAPQLQHSTTTVEVFCLTLAWALGVAGSTYLALSASAGRLAWGTAITGTAFCLFASSFIASLIHVGAFKGEVDYTGGVIGVVTHSVSAAVSTWGWLGAAVGFASGVLVGRYAFRLVRSNTQS
jgi:Uncharacterized protein conserved in bacteria (DUF2188)